MNIQRLYTRSIHIQPNNRFHRNIFVCFYWYWSCIITSWSNDHHILHTTTNDWLTILSKIKKKILHLSSVMSMIERYSDEMETIQLRLELMKELMMRILYWAVFHCLIRAGVSHELYVSTRHCSIQQLNWRIQQIIHSDLCTENVLLSSCTSMNMNCRKATRRWFRSQVRWEWKFIFRFKITLMKIIWKRRNRYRKSTISHQIIIHA